MLGRECEASQPDANGDRGAAAAVAAGPSAFIGILDIFGFEVFVARRPTTGGESSVFGAAWKDLSRSLLNV